MNELQASHHEAYPQGGTRAGISKTQSRAVKIYQVLTTC